ncbi:MAG TPA: type IX secretion system membrane protein PorP/SprF [Flavobacteriales bacterium]|jgi:type IX secretion system PorP/SprF family membrane protein|nr:type IX secretion system membrane protein PorP/SprF [Flavobacteriales bacterium]
MKIRLTVASIFSMVLLANAQQDPQFSQNMNNRLMVNAGYAGTSGAICGTAIGRSQWLGFEGAPKTFVLGVDMPIAALKGGVGLTLVQDAIGVENNVYAKLAYSYHLKLKTGTLGLGLDLGMMNKSLGKGLNPLQANDPSIPVNGAAATVFDAGLGFYYTSPKFYAGLSSSHLPQSTFDLGTSKYQARRHYYITAGYHYQLNPDIELRPSIFIKNAATTQFDINCNVHYKNKLWGGLSYRLQDAVIVMVGADVYKGVKLGLAYDVNTSKLNPYNNGTLEFMLNYCFKIKTEKPRQIYRNVRYL